MSVRSILIVILGLAAGAFAALGVMQAQKRPAGEKATAIPTVKVLVVSKKIERGHPVQEQEVELREWPERLLPEGTLREIKQAVGRVALGHLLPGEPVIEGKLAAVGSAPSAGNLIRTGMRAYSILATSAASSVAGLILPGDHVDVVLSVQSNNFQDPSGGGTSTTLLQNVEILAIDQNLEAPDENYSDAKLTTVTLLVTQRQAALLGLGQKAGTLTLSLRNPEDGESAETEPVTLASLRVREESTAGQEKEAPDATAEAASQPALDFAPLLAQAAALWLQPPAVAEPVPRKPRYSSIRTLRGSQPGVVAVALGDGGD